MKILFLFTYGTSLKNWSDSGYISREINFFKKMNESYGVEFSLLTFGDCNDLNLLKEYEYLEVIPIYKYLNKKKNKFLNFFYILFNLNKTLIDLDLNFDLIRTNQLFGSWIAIYLKLVTKKPLIVRTGYDLFLFSIKDKKNIFKIIAYYFLTFIALNMSDIYTVTSESDMKFINKFYIFKKKKLVLRRNWVTNISENKNIRNINREQNNCLSVGRLEIQKDFEYLIRLFNSSSYNLDIVGEGSLLTSLKNISNENINFLGNIEFSHLEELYSKYIFFVSATNYEGNPKSILEAMSKGCVVIAPDIPNISEIIKDKFNGILYDKKFDDVISIICSLKKETENLIQISKNAIKYVKTNNSLDLFTIEEFNDYQVLVAK